MLLGVTEFGGQAAQCREDAGELRHHDAGDAEFTGQGYGVHGAGAAEGNQGACPRVDAALDVIQEMIDLKEQGTIRGLIVAGCLAQRDAGELLDKLAERIKKVDAYVGYHAHGGDFTKIGDVTQWDLLFENSCDRVIMQMDIGNCIGGGGDPYATLQKFPGRSLTVHLKEHGGDTKAALGEGEVDWKKVFRICESTGGSKWYIVEHESGDDPLGSVAACLKNLRKMGK